MRSWTNFVWGNSPGTETTTQIERRLGVLVCVQADIFLEQQNYEDVATGLWGI